MIFLDSARYLLDIRRPSMKKPKKERLMRFTAAENKWLVKRASKLEITVTEVVRRLIDKARERAR